MKKEKGKENVNILCRYTIYNRNKSIRIETLVIQNYRKTIKTAGGGMLLYYQKRLLWAREWKVCTYEHYWYKTVSKKKKTRMEINSQGNIPVVYL